MKSLHYLLSQVLYATCLFSCDVPLFCMSVLMIMNTWSESLTHLDRPATPREWSPSGSRSCGRTVPAVRRREVSGVVNRIIKLMVSNGVFLTFKMEIWEKSFSSKYACVMSCSLAWSKPKRGWKPRQTLSAQIKCLQYEKALPTSAHREKQHSHMTPVSPQIFSPLKQELAGHDKIYCFQSVLI